MTYIEAISEACYIINHALFTLLYFKTPEEVWSSTPANYSECMLMMEN